MRTRFITSATAVSGFPPTELGEAAFLGRSNVGKSSLLNALTGARIARASGSPGRTQTVNFFESERDGGHVMLTDLPGYGFARAPNKIRSQFPGFIESYLLGRPTLRVALLLLDSRRAIEDEDKEVYAWLDGHLSPPRATWVVLTKSDKITKSKMKPTILRMASELSAPPDRVFATSTINGSGLDELRVRLYGLGALNLG